MEFHAKTVPKAVLPPSASTSLLMEWKLFLPSSLHVFMVSMNPRVGVGPHNLIIARSYQCESETQDQFIAKMCLQPSELKFKSPKMENVEVWFP